MSRINAGPYSLGMIIVLAFAGMTTAFAEVSSIETDLDEFAIGDEITEILR